MPSLLHIGLSHAVPGKARARSTRSLLLKNTLATPRQEGSDDPFSARRIVEVAAKLSRAHPQAPAVVLPAVSEPLAVR